MQNTKFNSNKYLEIGHHILSDFNLFMEGQQPVQKW